MRILFLLAAIFHASFGYEFYCVSGVQNSATPEKIDWAEVEKDMNERGELKYKFHKDLTPDALDQRCKKEDVLVVRRVVVKLTNKTDTYTEERYLTVITKEEIGDLEKNGACTANQKPEEPDQIEMYFTGFGNISVQTVTEACHFRKFQCGTNFYYYRSDTKSMWCRFNVHKLTTGTTAFIEHAKDKESLIRLYDDEMYCERDRKENPVTVLCLKFNCPPISRADVNKLCAKGNKWRDRKKSYTLQGSPWAREAFARFLRNCILIFIFYCYFMMQVRRAPMARWELTVGWKKFMSGIAPKDNEEMVDPTKTREKFIETRCKKEEKSVAARIENLQLETSQAKEEIAKQAAMIRDDDDLGSNRQIDPSSMIKPCSAHHLAELIQWSWIVESSMIRSMREGDIGDELCKFYGIEADHKKYKSAPRK